MEYLKIVSSMGIGALGMYFMYKLTERMLVDVVSALKDINVSMQKFITEQHQEHKEIIKLIKNKQ